MTFAVFAGCLGGSEEAPKTIPPEEFSGDTSLDGWEDYDEQGSAGDSVVDEVYTFNLNSSRIIYFKVRASLADSDAAHAETDDGSDPDSFNIKVNSSGFESEVKTGQTTGQTPQSLELELPLKNASLEVTGEQIEFGPEVSIVLHADCGGGKPQKFIPGPIPRPTPFVNIDQGIYYSFVIEYTYLDDAGAAVTEMYIH